MRFESGATGTLATVRAAPMFWRIQVFGTQGWAEARGETTLTVARNGEQPKTETFSPVNSLGVLIESFAESIETGRPFAVSTDDMLDVASAFEAIIRSMTDEASVRVRRALAPSS